MLVFRYIAPHGLHVHPMTAKIDEMPSCAASDSESPETV